MPKYEVPDQAKSDNKYSFWTRPAIEWKCSVEDKLAFIEAAGTYRDVFKSVYGEDTAVGYWG